MSGKPIQYWRDMWDKRIKPFTKEWRTEMKGIAGNDYPEYKAIATLLMYYSASNYAGIFGLRGGGACSRFWAGHWNTHHGNQVTMTLKKCHFYNMPKGEQNVDNILSTLEKNLEGRVLDPNGDLSRILQVIEEKVGRKVQVQKNQTTSNSEDKATKFDYGTHEQTQP